MQQQYHQRRHRGIISMRSAAVTVPLLSSVLLIIFHDTVYNRNVPIAMHRRFCPITNSLTTAVTPTVVTMASVVVPSTLGHQYNHHQHSHHHQDYHYQYHCDSQILPL